MTMQMSQIRRRYAPKHEQIHPPLRRTTLPGYDIVVIENGNNPRKASARRLNPTFSHGEKTTPQFYVKLEKP